MFSKTSSSRVHWCCIYSLFMLHFTLNDDTRLYYSQCISAQFTVLYLPNEKSDKVGRTVCLSCMVATYNQYCDASMVKFNCCTGFMSSHHIRLNRERKLVNRRNKIYTRDLTLKGQRTYLYNRKSSAKKVQFRRSPLGRSEIEIFAIQHKHVDVTDVSHIDQCLFGTVFEFFTEPCGQHGEHGGGEKSSRSWGE
jgi:hypothetical protein